MKSVKIFDASTIVCIFQEAKFPNFLNNCIKRNYNLVIPRQVYNEIEVNRNTFSCFREFIDFFTIEECLDEHFDYLTRRFPTLHQGEIGVLSVGLEYNKCGNKYICFLDDGHARDISKKLHLRTSGLIGLALWEKENGDISRSECEMVYHNIAKSNFRIKEEMLDKLIK
jgi:predicted nucleic acid-binding protein